MPPKSTTKTTSTTTTRGPRGGGGGKKTTRAALQDKQQLVEVDNGGEGEPSSQGRKRETKVVDSSAAGKKGKGTTRRNKTAAKPSDSEKPTIDEVEQPPVSRKSSRARAKPAGASSTASTAGENATTKAEEGGGKKRGRAGKQTTTTTTATKKAKMADGGGAAAGRTGRKRRKAGAPPAATATDSGEPEKSTDKISGVVGDGAALPPSKRRKDDDTNTDESVEETDRVVVAPPPSAVTKETSKQSKKTVRIAEGGPEVAMETNIVISHHSHSTVHGQVFVLGQGDTGQLGLGEEMMERKKPHPVGGDLSGLRVSQVVCGGMHTAALTDKGKVFTWGCNDEGALGRPTNSESEAFTPGVVERLKGWVRIVQISAGDSHTAALSDAGIVYGWGVFRDNNGAFGLLPPPAPPSPSPTPQIIYSSPNKALKITSGCDHMAIVTEHGDIYTLGRAEQGQLGRVAECFSSRGGRKGISLLLKPDVVRVRVKRKADKPKFSDAFCGAYQTFGVTEKGEVYTWGMNNYGQLCTGDTAEYFQPALLKDGWICGRGQGGVSGAGKNFGIASGQHHTVVCCGGDVLTCGRKEYGRLGLGKDSEEPSKPALVDSLKGVKVVSVEAGGSCSFVVTETGDLYSWGMGTNLQLGMADDEDVWTPQKVTGKKIENREILCVSVGGQHTVLLVSGGDGENG